jgi:hypothetical protein
MNVRDFRAAGPTRRFAARSPAEPRHFPRPAN